MNDGLESEVSRATAAENALGIRIDNETNRATAAENAIRQDLQSTKVHYDTRFNQVENRINKLQNKMEKGLAANAALTGLTPLSIKHRAQLSAAIGGYGSNQALAVGAYYYVNERILLNAGAAYGGNSDISYKAGVTFGF